ncbi:hypothetical protein [Streptomyces solincola]|uniref:hypothetical protein n=1 Tax=Streptomyces solincola TaxID=2100817 RepID=UPI0011B24055|nr:hypothetical protein [Streptomyces solincola]
MSGGHGGGRGEGRGGDRADERHGPDRPPHDRTGTRNDTVNDTPQRSERSARTQRLTRLDWDSPADDGRERARPGAFPALDRDGSALDAGEAELRRMLLGAVDGLTPAEDSLDRLRRAVPARRARKRQAVVGAAAAALLFGTAVPAFVHVAASDDAAEDRRVMAGHGEQAQSGTGGTEQRGEAGRGGAVGPDGPAAVAGSPPGAGASGTPSPDASEKAAPGEDPDGAPADSAAPVGSAAPVSTPVCEASQLGSALADLGRPDAEGKVYGAFRISNVSRAACAVGGAGTVALTTSGAADPAKVKLLRHTAGDPAVALPDPAREAAAPLLLPPAGSYEVKFAWVPGETCPTEGGEPEPTPEPPGPSEEPTTTPGGTEEGAADKAANTETQLGRVDGGPADGAVTVTHTAERGSPTAAAAISGACAGAVYHTGMLPAP